MRLIEKEMCLALNKGKNWRKDNTKVKWSANPSTAGIYAEVYLHGNLIAVYHPAAKELTLLDGGWQSVTTKSRLNALCTELISPRAGVHQRDWVWYFTNSAGETSRWSSGFTWTTN